MRAFAETNKYETVLLGDVQKYVLKRADEDRDPTVIHPSEMAKTDWCPRATTYRIRGFEPSNEDKVATNLRLQTIFQEGHDIHSKWQAWLAEMGVLWGDWECPSCRAWVTGFAPNVCTACGFNGRFFYREVHLRKAKESHLIVGLADGAVPEKNCLIEVKSIGTGTVRMEDPRLVSQHTVKAAESGKSIVDLDGLWKGIKRPLRSHRIQGSIYLWLAGLAEIPVDRMVYIYENKANQATKEFSITYDRKVIEDLLETAKDIKWSVDKNLLPPRPPGFTKDSKPCNSCVFKDRCWDTTSDQASSEQPKTPGRRSVVRRSRAADQAEDPPARTTDGRVPRTAGRSYRTGRQRVDVSVRRDDQVDRVPGRAVGHGRGRREVRRRSSRPDPG